MSHKEDQDFAHIITQKKKKKNQLIRIYILTLQGSKVIESD